MSCITLAALSPATQYPVSDRCTAQVTLVPMPSSAPVSLTMGAFASTSDALASRLAALASAQAPLAQQVEALQADRQAARGSFSLTLPVNSFSSAEPVAFSLQPASSTTNSFAAAAAAAFVASSAVTDSTGARLTPSVDAAAAVKLGPACTVFTTPVQVCIFVGDTAPSTARSLRLASQVDCADESKGYGTLDTPSNVTWDPVTGLLCGSVEHFSLALPVLLPVPTTPTVRKTFAMGGSCPNACSDRGFCRESGACLCFAGFTGPDCSQRTCPAAESWAASRGGSVGGCTGATCAPGGTVGHQSAECAGAGVCDRASGICKCFAGYDGAACQRTSCPNDCSGNGVCRTLRELPAVAASGYTSWEADRLQVCACDAGFSGPDCSLRTCPHGADPEQAGGGATSTTFTLTLSFGSIPTQYANVIPPSVYSTDELSLIVLTADGGSFSTPRVTGVFDAASAPARVAAALTSLPGLALSDVRVAAMPGSNTQAQSTPSVTYAITLDAGSVQRTAVAADGTSGTLSVEASTAAASVLSMACAPAACSSPGCRPLTKQLRILDASSAGAAGIAVSAGVLLTQPPPLAAGDATVAGVWGVVITITISANGVAGGLTFAATSQIYEAGAGASVPATPLPPDTLRASVPILYGLRVDFPSGPIVPGAYVIKWRLPTCSITQTQRSGWAAAECSRRGLCDRSTGECTCFAGYSGYSCSQQTVIL